MASTEARVRKLVDENIEVDGRPIALPEDLNISLMDLGVSSVELVAFAKLVSQEFNIKFTLEDCGKINTVQELLEYLDSRAG